MILMRATTKLVAVFQTRLDGERIQLGFWYRTLNSAKRNYSAPERKCIVLIWALETLTSYMM